MEGEEKERWGGRPTRGVSLAGGPREAAVCCEGREGTLSLFACVQPRQSQGWGGSENGVWPEHDVVRQSHCSQDEH